MVFFDTKNEKDSTFDTLPEGRYRVYVANTEVKKTKAGTGEYAAIKFQVVNGPHQGHSVFANFNIVNQNPKAQQIGRAEFKRFLTAIGVTEALQDAMDMHRHCQSKMLDVEVAHEEFNGQPQARVTKFHPADGAPVAPSSPDDNRVPF